MYWFTKTFCRIFLFPAWSAWNGVDFNLFLEIFCNLLCMKWSGFQMQSLFEKCGGNSIAQVFQRQFLTQKPCSVQVLMKRGSLFMNMIFQWRTSLFWMFRFQLIDFYPSKSETLEFVCSVRLERLKTKFEGFSEFEEQRQGNVRSRRSFTLKRSFSKEALIIASFVN